MMMTPRSDGCCYCCYSPSWHLLQRPAGDNDQSTLLLLLLLLLYVPVVPSSCFQCPAAHLGCIYSNVGQVLVVHQVCCCCA
jgi:hypothetical protein